MNDTIRRELEDIPVCYTHEILRDSYRNLLSRRERRELPMALTRALGPLIRAGAAMTQDQKARLLYEALSQSLTYDETAYAFDGGLRRFSYIGGLTSGKAVCMGIAELYTLLGTAFGLRVQTVIGYGGDPVHRGGLHAWNLVWLSDPRLGQIPYHVDLTWDLEANVRIRGYKFYLKSDRFMERHDHTWLRERYPACPVSRSPYQIPRIPRAAVDLVARRLRLLQTRTTNA